MELSEEEKKAIERLKLFEYRYTLVQNDDKVIETIINLIDKKQKEIEELKIIKLNFENWKEDYKELLEATKENDKITVYVDVPPDFKDNYIHKDRIREAIRDRELEIYADNEEICNADGFYNIAFLYDKTIDVLKELLEEE
jgi:hypothetical protein